MRLLCLIERSVCICKVSKSGTVIYDYKKVRAYFIDKKLTNENVKKSEIKNLISNPNSIILLDQSLLIYSKLDSSNLASCRNDKSFIVKKKQLTYNPFQLIPIENKHFHKVAKEYHDLVERIVFCQINNE